MIPLVGRHSSSGMVTTVIEVIELGCLSLSPIRAMSRYDLASVRALQMLDQRSAKPVGELHCQPRPPTTYRNCIG